MKQDLQAPSTDTPPAGAPPMTSTLMARLWIVPAIIVCVLLGVAVVVVLFGTSSTGQPESVDVLLARLERGGGGRTMSFMLLPNDKAYWQAAQELSQRLAKKDDVLSSAEVDHISERLIEIIDAPDREGDQATLESGRQILLVALGQCERATALPVMRKSLRSDSAGMRLAALRGAGAMRRMPEADRLIDDMVPLLRDPESAVRIGACAALSVVAEPGDAAVIDAISAQLDEIPEVSWNASLALARLGSARGKFVLMNMLDRGFWERYKLDYEEGGRRVVRGFTDVQIADHLAAAIDASIALGDSQLLAMIEALQDDSSLRVRQAARDALAAVTDESGKQTAGSPDAAVTALAGEMR